MATEDEQALAILNSTVSDLCDTVFRGTWVSIEDEDERSKAIETFRALVKFVNALRISFDDVLTVEQAKGNLEDVEHIRKPYKKDDKPSSMVDLLKKLNK